MSSEIGERRFAPVYLALSAAALVGIVATEGYSDKAIVPVPGDKPTIGFGSTTRPDGSPVQMGDRTTAPKALARALLDVQRFEGALKECVTVPLHQYEYDAFISFSYNIGSSAFCQSQLVTKLNALDYAGACAEILRWRFFQGKDCSLNVNKCSGLWLRRNAEYRLCLGVGQ
jgi:lysozyme